MTLLLDTCAFLWLVLEPMKLSRRAVQLIQDPNNHVWMSSVSAWEIGVAYSLGRLSLQDPPALFIPAQRRLHGLDALALTEADALLLPDLPPIHRDPFDRMLICQARANGLTLLTPDPTIRRYPSLLADW